MTTPKLRLISTFWQSLAYRAAQTRRQRRADEDRRLVVCRESVRNGQKAMTEVSEAKSC